MVLNALPDVIWVLAGPSGSGKTTLANALVARSGGGVRRALTCTTRPPRPGERSGVDYRFVSTAEFDSLRSLGELLEETEYGGNHYGVPLSEVRGAPEVVVVVDSAGIRHVKDRFGPRAVAIHLAGLSADDLSTRLSGRGASVDEIEARLRNLAEEASALEAACDYHIPPGSPEEVLEAVGALMERERAAARR